MKIVKPSSNWEQSNISIFLAGSIEMGSAEDWQKKIESELIQFEELVIFNPRRDN